MNRKLVAVCVAAVAALAAAIVVGARPNRYGHSDREERHLMPAVSSGPFDPAWSPDGRWIAFSMRGDIWKVSAGGGEAVAVTSGPAYHFEPSWSPDGVVGESDLIGSETRRPTWRWLIEKLATLLRYGGLNCHCSRTHRHHASDESHAFRVVLDAADRHTTCLGAKTGGLRYPICAGADLTSASSPGRLRL